MRMMLSVANGSSLSLYRLAVWKPLRLVVPAAFSVCSLFTLCHSIVLTMGSVSLSLACDSQPSWL
jgi:hypothetical protein